MPDKLQILLDQERILRELGKKKELGLVLGSQADLLASQGKYLQAVEKLSEAETLFDEADYIFGVGKALFDQVRILQQSSEPGKLLAVLQRQEDYYRKNGDDEDLAECLFNQTMAVHELGDLRKEVELCKQQIPIWQRLNNGERVAFCYGSAAMSLVRLNVDLDIALDMACQSEQVCRGLSEPSLLARALNTKAFVLWEMKRNREAMVACTASMRIAKEKGISQWIEHNKPMLEQLVREQFVATFELLFPKPRQAKEAWTELEFAASLIDNAEVSEMITKLRPLFSRLP
jgi:hypothetical protein